MRVNEAMELVKEQLEGKQYGKEFVSKECPFCGRAKSRFYINTVTGQYSCKSASCGASGNLTTLFKHLGIEGHIEYDTDNVKQHKTPPQTFKADVSSVRTINETDEVLVDYMLSRGISLETLNSSNVFISDRHNALTFLTKRDGKLLGVLYRKPGKKLFMEAGSEQRLWGVDTCDTKSDTLYITEGHPDCLTLREMGYYNSVSVPNGASSHDWIDRDWEFLNKFKKIVLCYDNDEAGEKAIMEVKNRLDFASLYELEYGSSKDINEMYMEDCENLFKTVRNPKEISMDGFISLQNVTTNTDPLSMMSSCGIPQFDRIFGGMRLHETTVIAASSGAGKAQPLYAKISTPKGWKRMGEIKVGDIINGFDKTTRVVGIYPQGIRPVYEIELTDGRKTRADIEHIWTYTSKEFRGYKLKNGTTKELIERLNSGKTVILPEADGVEYDKQDLPIHPYAVGALIGDGCLTCNGIQISSSEEDVVERVAKYMGAKYRKLSKENYTWYIYADKKPIVELGMACTARDKRIPNIYMKSSKDDRLMLLKGIFDTDGSIREGNRLTISTMSSGLKDDIVELCMSLGIKTGVSEDSREKYKNEGICYSISLQTSKIVFSSDKHKSRYDFELKKRYDNKRTYVKSITYIGEEECQCIKVDADDSLYITDDFIATHNTTVVSNLINGYLSSGEKTAVWSGELTNSTLKTWIYSVIAGEKAISSVDNPFRPGDKISMIKPEYEEKIDRAVDGKLFVYDGNKSDAFKMLDHFELLHKRNGVTNFIIDNGSILNMNVAGVGKYDGEEAWAKRAAEFARNNAVRLYIVMHPTKTTINADPNYLNAKGKVKKPEMYDQYQIRGSASIPNLAHNILFLIRAGEHYKAWVCQKVEEQLTKAKRVNEIPQTIELIKRELSLIAYLAKNRGGGNIFEEAMFGYSPEVRRIYGLHTKAQDLSKEFLLEDERKVDEVVVPDGFEDDFDYSDF